MLERGVGELKRVNEILRLSRRYFRSGCARPPQEFVKAFIDEHREHFELEPICRALQAAPSMYWGHAARRKNPALRCRREQRDEVLAGAGASSTGKASA